MGPENVIYEVALKEGYRLDSPIETGKRSPAKCDISGSSANQKQLSTSASTKNFSKTILTLSD